MWGNCTHSIHCRDPRPKSSTEPDETLHMSDLNRSSSNGKARRQLISADNQSSSSSAGMAFADSKVLTLSCHGSIGDFTLFVGWQYMAGNLTMVVSDEHSKFNVFVLSSNGDYRTYDSGQGSKYITLSYASNASNFWFHFNSALYCWWVGYVCPITGSRFRIIFIAFCLL